MALVEKPVVGILDSQRLSCAEPHAWEAHVHLDPFGNAFVGRSLSGPLPRSNRLGHFI